MKLFLIAFAVIAAVAADVSHLPLNEYLPPTHQHYENVEQVQFQTPSNDYLPPVEQHQQVQYQEVAPAHELADDGYRYRTNRRRVVVRRHRRDVSHLPSNDYLPPTQHYENVEQVQFQTPSNEYLAPVQQHQASVQQYEAPVQQIQQVEYQAPIEAQPAHELAADGYRYKTQRRRVIRRNRRDVSHLPSNDYLPPTQHYENVEQVQYQTPSNDYLPPVQQYQAPVQQYQAPVQQYQAPVQQYQQVQYQAPVEAEPAHELANDGYRYKTHRRRVVVRRNRRDVSHLPSNDYLPPTQHYENVEQVQYQTPSNDYLPPVQQHQAPIQPYQAPLQTFEQVQYQTPVEAEPAHELANDGYRYKTHRRRVVVRRNRRDVSHLPTSEYLPPSQEVVAQEAPAYNYAPVQQVQEVQQIEQVQQVQAQAPVQQAPVQQQVQYQTPVEAEPAHELAQDGYHYKTHRRVVYRRH